MDLFDKFAVFKLCCLMVACATSGGDHSKSVWGDPRLAQERSYLEPKAEVESTAEAAVTPVAKSFDSEGVSSRVDQLERQLDSVDQSLQSITKGVNQLAASGQEAKGRRFLSLEDIESVVRGEVVTLDQIRRVIREETLDREETKEVVTEAIRSVMVEFKTVTGSTESVSVPVDECGPAVASLPATTERIIAIDGVPCDPIPVPTYDPVSDSADAGSSSREVESVPAATGQVFTEPVQAYETPSFQAAVQPAENGFELLMQPTTSFDQCYRDPVTGNKVCPNTASSSTRLRSTRRQRATRSQRGVLQRIFGR